MAIPIQMTVKIFSKKVMVDPPQAQVPEGQSGELIWTVNSELLNIEYIGFNSPVGPGNQIQDLREEEGTTLSTWKAHDNNSARGLLSYSIFVRVGDQVYSSDPQIVNEGPPGGDEEMPPWESKP